MKCFICQTDSFIFCSLCKRSFCPEHKCFHIGDLDQDDFLSEKSNNEVGPEGAYHQSDEFRKFVFDNRNDGVFRKDRNNIQSETEKSDHWLSNRVIFSSLSEAKLLSEKKRYQTLIRLIEEELRSRYNPTFSKKSQLSMHSCITHDSLAKTFSRIPKRTDRKIKQLLKDAKRLGILSKIMEMLK